MEQKKWYQKTGWIIALLILFFPIGLFLMWKYANWNKIIKIIITVLFALSLIGNMASPSTPQSEDLGKAQTESSTEATEKMTDTEPKSSSVAADEKTPEVQPETIESVAESQDSATANMTMGQQNALRSAKSYLDFTAFSYQGLITQLEFDKFSNEDAVYAADNCGADWNEQALKSAQNYLDFSAFSYSGLITQLEFDKFTSEQATYGADNCGADWNEQAALSAAAYLEFSSFSRDSLIHQLEFDGFTSEQAAHGAQANGY